MKILAFGDIYGRIGRKAIAQELPKLRKKFTPDFVVANIENCTSGRGPVLEHIEFFENLGIDCMTGGDHIYDRKESIADYLQKNTAKLLRPANFYPGPQCIGPGYIIVEKNGFRLCVMHLLGEVFMLHRVENPFLYAQKLLEDIPRESYDACVIDFHKEATAEIYGLGYFLDGKVSAVYGTHTHVQTADAHILKNGTGLIADVGMNGPKNSIIGADPACVIPRFLSGISKGKIEQQVKGDAVISALLLEIDPKTGNCIHIESLHYSI